MNKNLLKESVRHGDSMLPMKVYSGQHILNETIFNCHWHDEFELLMVIDGEALFQIDNDYYEVGKGQAIFIQSDTIHSGTKINDRHCAFHAVVFSPEFLCSITQDAVQSYFIEPLIEKKIVPPIFIKGESEWEKEVIKSIDRVVELYLQKPYAYELSIKGYLYLIISKLISNTNRNSKTKKLSDDNTRSFKSVISFIHKNYNKKISVKQLAEIANMSVGHFQRFFKKIARKTVVNYINFYRISKSTILLTTTNEKIISIAIQVGFENVSYFNTVFKTYMHCTPKEYRSRFTEQ